MKSEIVEALKETLDRKLKSESEIAEKILEHISKGKITQEDILGFDVKLHPNTIIESENEDGSFETQEIENGNRLEFHTKCEKANAEWYLKDTDWVISKIGEMQIEGQDFSELLIKYKDVLETRKEMREILNK